MSDAITECVNALRDAIARQREAYDRVSGLEKALDIAKADEDNARASVARHVDVLKGLLDTRDRGKAVGDVYREQGVPGYENWKRM